MKENWKKIFISAFGISLILVVIVSALELQKQRTYTNADSVANIKILASEFESGLLKTIQGQCGPGVEQTRVVLYCNDSGRILPSQLFAVILGQYEIIINGASSNTSNAGVTVKIGTQNVGTVFWNSTILSEEKLLFTINSSPNVRDIEFILTTDNGSNDTILDKFTINLIPSLGSGSTQPTVVPSVAPLGRGAVSTGIYKNLFAEAGYTSAQISTKLNAGFNSLFYGPNNGNQGDPSNAAVYKVVDANNAFILDVNNNDIRSEGQSYGMMIATQMNKKAEFDKLWNFARDYMRCPRANQCKQGSGKEGYFSWQLNSTAPFSAIDEGSAPDGEEYFATSLIFAGYRWGNTGAINYHAEAQSILNAMLNDSRPNGMRSIFNKEKKVIVFAPIGNSANYSDPSYHLPAFYEVWARFDSNLSQKVFWQQAAGASRSYFKTASGHTSGRTNGLMPDCSDHSGNAVYGCAGGAVFAYDAWRAGSNVSVDYAWWANDNWQVSHSSNLQNFFGPKMPSYPNGWNLNGTPTNGDVNSPGLISMNATLGLSSQTQYTKPLVDALWNLEAPKGRYRYYDGLLYQMAMLHASGSFKAYMGSSLDLKLPPTQVPTQTPTPTATPKPINTPVVTATQTPPPPTATIPNPISGSISFEVSAAGTPSSNIYPTMQVYADGKLVSQITGVTGNINQRSFNLYKYLLSSKPSKIRINFPNDEATNTGDRNLIVDYIKINGIVYQAEDQSVYSDSCYGGYKGSEWLYCTGYMEFTIK